MEYGFAGLGPTLRIVVLIFLVVFALLILGLVVALAALPGQIAKRRKHPQSEAINICGWVGLPTGVLWCIALVWAYMRPISPSPSAAIEPMEWQRISQNLDRLEKSVARIETILGDGEVAQ